MTRQDMKQTALRMVETAGLINLSRSGLCERAGIPDGSFPHIMGCNFSEFIQELQREGVSSELHPVNKTRADPELRKAHILDTAVAVARNLGYTKLTRVDVAKAAGVSDGLISRYFPLMDDLKEAVIVQAVRHEIPEIIAQGLAAKDPQVKWIPADLRQKAIQILLAG